jgi:hypothetical protein
MERNKRDQQLVLPMPSLAELSSMLVPMKELALEGNVETQSRYYQEQVQRQGRQDAPTEFVAFTVPLDSYLPLSEGHTVHTTDKQSAHMTMVHNAALETKIGSKKLTAVLTALVVALGNKDTSTPLAELDETTIMSMYKQAIQVANNTIMAYKLTPGRHNHNLQPITVTNRPSFVDIFRFSTVSGEIIEAGNVHMHQNLVASVECANSLEPQEHDTFLGYFRALGPQNDEPITNILATIYQAIDEVCVGNYASGLVLADTYAEHSMRYSLLELYTSGGLAEEAAMGKVDSLRTLEKLVGGLATELHVPRPSLKRIISFDTWQAACRQKRNHITHRFTKLPVEPQEARTALHETIRMITSLTRFIMSSNINTAQHLRLFGAPGWYTGSIEAYSANDGRSISRVTDIIPYKYIRPGEPSKK